MYRSTFHAVLLLAVFALLVLFLTGAFDGQISVAW